MHVRELCKWLKARNMLVYINGEADILPEASGLLPPSMQRLVLGVVDQLPAGPGMLVRSASVLGMQFSSRLLMKMVSVSVASDYDTLLDLLDVLSRFNIVAVSLPSGSDPSNTVWQ
eukprot:scaffold209852_cov40-Prasinocladus_malaysianus.AAC.1